MGKLKKIINNKFVSTKFISLKSFLILIFLVVPLSIYFNFFFTNHVRELSNLSISKFLPLNLETMNITGNKNITHKEIIDKIKINKDISILAINLDNLETQIMEFDLVDSVHIERILPNSLNIEIIEKKPIGIIQNKNSYQLITENGSIINFKNIDKFNHLPIFVGKNVQFNE